MLNFKSSITVVAIATILGSTVLSSQILADENVKAKVQETVQDSKRASKKAARKVKDEICEMLDGKMKCVGKKIKHATQNAGDAVEDAVD